MAIFFWTGLEYFIRTFQAALWMMVFPIPLRSIEESARATFVIIPINFIIALEILNICIREN